MQSLLEDRQVVIKPRKTPKVSALLLGSTLLWWESYTNYSESAMDPLFRNSFSCLRIYTFPTLDLETHSSCNKMDIKPNSFFRLESVVSCSDASAP